MRMAIVIAVLCWTPTEAQYLGIYDCPGRGCPAYPEPGPSGGVFGNDNFFKDDSIAPRYRDNQPSSEERDNQPSSEEPPRRKGRYCRTYFEICRLRKVTVSELRAGAN